TVTASGLLSAPAIDAHLSGSALQFRGLSAAQVDVRAAYEAAARRVDVSSARIQAPWGRLAASGQLALVQEGRSRMHSVLTGVDMAAMMRGLNLPYIGDTRVDGEIDAEWPGLDYVDASGRATATLIPPMNRAARTAVPVGGRLSASRSGGTIVAELQQI